MKQANNTATMANNDYTSRVEVLRNKLQESDYNKKLIIDHSSDISTSNTWGDFDKGFENWMGNG